MRIASVLLLCCCIFTGCKSEDQLLDKAINLRTALLDANSCSFTAVILGMAMFGGGLIVTPFYSYISQIEPVLLHNP